jgi:integrase
MPKAESQTIDQNAKNFLTESEMKKFLDAARKSCYGVRNFCLMLMAYCHGLRVSELVDIRLKDLDFDSGRIFIQRL